MRDRRWQEIDVDQLIEEIEDLGKSERRAITSQLIRLLLHLLKWQYQPERRSDSWLDSITDARTPIDLAVTLICAEGIADSPSLKTYPLAELESSSQRARRQAAKQTNLDVSTFPIDCPYSLESVLDENWLPENR